MGRVRGNPNVLLLLFFGLAVFLTGSLYAVADRAWAGRGLIDTVTVAGLVVSLGVVLLILLRIVWVAAKATDRTSEAPSGVKAPARPEVLRGR